MESLGGCEGREASVSVMRYSRPKDIATSSTSDKAERKRRGSHPVWAEWLG